MSTAAPSRSKMDQVLQAARRATQGPLSPDSIDAALLHWAIQQLALLEPESMAARRVELYVRHALLAAPNRLEFLKGMPRLLVARLVSQLQSDEYVDARSHAVGSVAIPPDFWAAISSWLGEQTASSASSKSKPRPRAAAGAGAGAGPAAPPRRVKHAQADVAAGFRLPNALPSSDMRERLLAHWHTGSSRGKQAAAVALSAVMALHECGLEEAVNLIAQSGGIARTLLTSVSSSADLDLLLRQVVDAFETPAAAAAFFGLEAAPTLAALPQLLHALDGIVQGQTAAEACRSAQQGAMLAPTATRARWYNELADADIRQAGVALSAAARAAAVHTRAVMYADRDVDRVWHEFDKAGLGKSGMPRLLQQYIAFVTEQVTGGNAKAAIRLILARTADNVMSAPDCSRLDVDDSAERMDSQQRHFPAVLDNDLQPFYDALDETVDAYLAGLS